MLLLRNKDQLMIWGVGAFLLVVFLNITLLKVVPQQNEVADLEYQLSSKKQKLVALKDENISSRILLEYSSSIGEAKSKLLHKFSSTEFSNLMDKAAKGNNVIIVSEDYNVVGKNQEQQIQLELIGSYESIRNIFNKISSFPFFIVIEKFSIRIKTDDVVSAKMFLNVYSKEQLSEQ